MNGLRAELISRTQSPDGPLAEINLIEPNGDQCAVRCLLRNDGTTDIGGWDKDTADYLNEKYHPKEVCQLVRRTALEE